MVCGIPFAVREGVYVMVCVSHFVLFRVGATATAVQVTDGTSVVN